MANQMMVAEIEARKKSVWKRSKIWGCKDWWLMAIPNSLLLSCAIAFMVQIIPVLLRYNAELSVLAVPGFVLMSQGFSAVMFGLSFFACFGSWLLGVIDTKYGTRTAVFITAILMLAAGLVGMIDNPWAAVAACWLLGLFMGASSNFGLSAIVRYWRQEDFPSVYSGAPPLGTVIGSTFPFIIATIAARFTYNGASSLLLLWQLFA
jgi:MFS family permease